MRGDPLDRSAHRRRDAAWLAAAREDPRTRVVPVWRGRCLVTARPARAVTPALADGRVFLEQAEEVVFLGLDGEAAVLLVDLPQTEEPPAAPEGTSFRDLFRVGPQLPPDELSLLAYARGMAYWHRNARFDPASGGPTRSVDGGFARVTDDDRRLFPRTDPAVMVLVTHGDRCLLARQATFPPGMYSALAGFVEVGESLEECVVRETYEEVGLQVKNLRYVESQPWPFPRSLMIGFLAESDTTGTRLDDEEIEDVRWVTREEVQAPRGYFIPPPMSLAHHLILGWARGTY